MNIAEIETKYYRECLEFGRKNLLNDLKARDNELLKIRDKKRYRDKGLRKTCIKTIMGEVEFSRHVYSDRESGEYVFLLDKELGLGEFGKISPTIVSCSVKASSEAAFREAARQINDITGLSISHQTVWDITQKAGVKLRAKEKKKSKEKLKKTGILFEECDGIWLHLQGKDRKENGRSKEMKIAISYDGIRKEGRRRICDSKTACAGFMEPEEFREKAEQTIKGAFDTEAIDARILNGDGAGWIFDREDHVIKQLDIFHRNKALRANIADEELVKEIQEKLYEKDIEGVMEYLEAYKNSVKGGKAKEKAETIYKYYDNHKDMLLNYYRRGLKLPEVNEGLVRAKLGAMESNVFSLIGNRMKGRRKCWSLEGANNMAEILCLKHTGRLDKALREIDIPVNIVKEEPEGLLILTASEIPETVGKGYNGYKTADLTHLSKGAYAVIRRYSELEN